jgi:hypothetical protein
MSVIDRNNGRQDDAIEGVGTSNSDIANFADLNILEMHEIGARRSLNRHEWPITRRLFDACGRTHLIFSNGRWMMVFPLPLFMLIAYCIIITIERSSSARGHCISS